jgi:3-dehydroquinate synthase
VSEPIRVQSHAGPYEVRFEHGEPAGSWSGPASVHLLVDARVAELYPGAIARFADRPRVTIEASEPAKALERCPAYVEQLVAGGIRRGHLLLAIGGGVIQDITCFLAAVLLRGIDWSFYPTTLLAQADSCIGSKSSINVGSLKNIVGTFTPPKQIVANTRFLRTLAEPEIRSGIGEMLKVHAIDSPEAFDRIAADYGRLSTDHAVLEHYIRDSLLMKRRLIEADEFDEGVRRVMNYGHTFGHAIESATDFAIPHGIAVSMGMDMANWIAGGVGIAPIAHFTRMHPVLATNYRGFERLAVPADRLAHAIAKDKKNTDAGLTLVLTDANGTIGLHTCRNDGRFRDLCADFLENRRTA